ncbi:FAD-dependent oxidoreductase [Agrobacterium sp. BA1120]|uniref:NAD(P)/FAD-dependent oxidoreductase n=1 Tax=Agrobacterium sp. BA1120 TaxID=3228927 RepID=UPI00336A4363
MRCEAPDVDVIVLGAGIVGISTALHLQMRGLRVAIIDRQEPGKATSYGNAGFIETSAILPHPFPKGIANLLRLAFNRSTAVKSDYRFLLKNLPWLFAYKRASSTSNLEKIASPFRRLSGASLAEHRLLIEKTGAGDLLNEDGWLELCRTERDLQEADRAADAARDYGINARKIDGSALSRLEPALKTRFAGAIHWLDTARIVDPGGLMTKLRALFTAQQGVFQKGDALGLRCVDGVWEVPASDGILRAPKVVVALGPWSVDLVQKLGYRMPFIAKRGYHQHFQNASPPLQRAIYVRDRHCLIVPMVQGVRVMTGVELAPRDALPTPCQMEKMIDCAHETLALGERLDAKPWLGARPCMADMLPVIGAAPRHKGLWFGFGHGHYGFTQGPVTGRLLAELMGGEQPFLPVEPYSPARFERKPVTWESIPA